MRRTERKEWFVIDKVWKKKRSRSSFGIFHKEEDSDNKAKHNTHGYGDLFATPYALIELPFASIYRSIYM